MENIKYIDELTMNELVEITGGTAPSTNTSFGYDVGYVIGYVLYSFCKGLSAVKG